MSSTFRVDDPEDGVSRFL